ncbi:MAG: iron ABC transporter permease [Flavobacteriales bacterium]|nr:iron ABC transporter permease [Flavobacteriales bacterium]
MTAPFHAPAPEWAHVFRDVLPVHLLETVLLLTGTVLLSVVIGVLSAWLVAAYAFPLRGLMRWMLVLPLAVPTYISAYTYAALLGPTGTISLWVHDRSSFRPDIVDLPGLIVVLAVVLFPYIYLPARAVFASGLREQLEAARMLGAHGSRRFLGVAVPLARPAIVGGAVLVAMETLNDYGAVKYYGIRTLTTAVFRSWTGLSDLGSALRVALILVVLVTLLLWVERRSRIHRRQATDAIPMSRQRLTGARATLASGWCLLVLFFGFVLPGGKLLLDAATPQPAYTWTTDLIALRNTLGVATGAALLTLLIAVLLIFLLRHGQGSWTRGLVRAATLGYAIPGAVIAVGVMTAAGTIDRQAGLSFTLIGTIGLLLYAFTVRFLAVAVQPMQGSLARQHSEVDDAARMLGASPLRTFLHINLPQLRPAILAAAMLVAIDVVKGLPLTLILRPFNFDTLSTRVFEMARIEQLRETARPALFIVLCVLPPLLFLDRQLARSEG